MGTVEEFVRMKNYGNNKGVLNDISKYLDHARNLWFCRLAYHPNPYAERSETDHHRLHHPILSVVGATEL